MAASNTVLELMYAPWNLQIPAAHSASLSDLQNSGVVVSALGTSLTTANVSSFSRTALVLASYQNPAKKF
jgi:hypothetical protein